LERFDCSEPAPRQHQEQHDAGHDDEAEVRISSHSANITDFDAENL
jgi:hypothetical protein